MKIRCLKRCDYYSNSGQQANIDESMGSIFLKPFHFFFFLIRGKGGGGGEGVQAPST